MIDVAIVGGGVAGLAAARDLSRGGLRCVLLEARPRLGGRVSTENDATWPVPIELGAEFLHGPAPATRAVAHEAGLPVVALPDRHAWAGPGGRRGMRGLWSELLPVLRRVPQRGRDQSFGAFLARQRGLSRRERTLARTFVEGYDAAPLADVSAQSLAVDAGETPDAERQYRLRDGQTCLVDALRAGLDPSRAAVRVATIVEAIEWTRGRVVVRCAGVAGSDVWRARAALVTVPVSLLQPAASERIRFDPPLPALECAVTALGMGHVQKIVLRFRARLWDERTDFLHDPSAAFPTWWTQSPVLAPVITGWAGGPAALALDGKSDRAVADAALAALARVLGIPRRRVAAGLEAWRRHDWSRDPWSRGAYSYVRVGGLPSQARLRRGFAGTIFVAGEATDPDETGTVNGAIASGRRAARAIRARLAAG